MPPSKNKEYFHSLTSLRGIAALWVAIGHISWTLPSTGLVAFLPIVRQGYLAVDFFFVLSGFVLAHAYQVHNMQNWKDYIKFCRARIARIFPIHICILGVFAVFYFLFLKNGVNLPGIYDIKALVLEFFLLHIIPIFDNTYFFAWNYPSWTLFLEVWWFIAVVGCIVLFNKSVGKTPLRLEIFQNRKTFLVLVFGLLLTLVGILVFKKSPAFINDPNFYNSVVRSGFEFLAGLLLYRAFLEKKFEFKKHQSYFLYFLILAGIFIWSSALPLYIIVGYWLILIPLIIMLALDKNTALHNFLIHPGFLHLGNISYSLYLIHGPIERIVAALYTKSGHSLINILLMYSLFIGGILILASLTYKYIEKPSIKYFKKKSA